MWVRTLVLALVFTVLSTIVAYRFIAAHAALSFQDEYVYLDAVDKAARGIVTRTNATVDEYAMRIISCRGVELFGYQGSACGAPLDPAQFPYDGYTTAPIHSPLYFFLTAWLAKGILFFFPGEELVQVARVTGALWLGLGLTASWRFIRALKGSRTMALTLCLLILASPQIRWSNFYITPDAFSLLAGALIMLAALKLVRGEWSAWPLVLISLFMTMIKFQMVFATGAALLFVIVWQFLHRADRPRWWKPIAWSGLATLLALAAQFSYQKLRYVYALPYSGDNDPVDPVGDYSLRFAAEQLDNFILNLYMGTGARHQAYTFYVGLPHAMVTLAGLLLVSGVVAVCFFRIETSREVRTLAHTLLFSTIIIGPLFYTYINVTTGSEFDLPPRYAEALFPLYCVGLPMVVKNRWTQWAMLVFSLLVLASALITNDLL